VAEFESQGVVAATKTRRIVAPCRDLSPCEERPPSEPLSGLAGAAKRTRRVFVAVAIPATRGIGAKTRVDKGKRLERVRESNPGSQLGNLPRGSFVGGRIRCFPWSRHVFSCCPVRPISQDFAELWHGYGTKGLGGPNCPTGCWTISQPVRAAGLTGQAASFLVGG
jgi:hypothetical protein